jgi:molecular chaperone GrpE
MDEEHQQAGSPSDGGDHRARSKRRDGSAAGKQHGPASTHAESAAATFVSSLGDIRLTDEQAATLERAVQQRVADEQAKCEDAVQRLVRTQADFANYKRRNDQEREQQARYANLLLVQELLPVLDNLDRALATIPDSVSSLPWMDGLVLVDRQLRATLEKQGLKPIVALGTRFDPMVHEAIIQEPTSDYEDDEVIAELQRGYMLHDKVVRPTLVKVAKRVESAASTTEEN